MNIRTPSGKIAISCSPGRTLTCAGLAVLLFFTGCGKHPGVAKYGKGDYAGAMRDIKEMGHPAAQYNLGLFYLNGEGVAKDHREAARWFRMAAGQQSVPAQVYLGVMALRGQGVKKNRQEAIAWFTKAAAQGSEPAQRFLDEMNARKGTKAGGKG